MNQSPTLNRDIAFWAGYFGDSDLALRAIARWGEPGYYWYPLLADARRLPGFKQLVRDAGLIEYWRQSGWSEFCQRVGVDDFECE